MKRLSVALLLFVVIALPSVAAEERKPEAGTAEVKGLSLSVKPAKAEFGAGEAIALDVVLKNTSDKTFQLYDPGFYMYDVNAGTWQCILKNVETKKDYRPMATMRPMVHRILQSVELEPGKTHTTKITLGRGLSFRVVGDNAGGGNAVQPGPGVKVPGRFVPGLANQPLPGGKYVLALTAIFKDGKNAEELPPGIDKKKSDAPFWTDSISVETAQFTVAEGKVGVLPGPNLGGWVKLFADEDWYRNQKGQERLFTGVLNAVKQDPDMATTLQRASLYTLDKRAIYTGTKKVGALDALVGKVVTIRGKTYDIQLEGQAVREIWPAAVMEAKEPLHPIEIHPKPIDPPADPAPPDEGEKMDLPADLPPVKDRLPASPEPIRPPIQLD